jgi:hypothetical protein
MSQIVHVDMLLGLFMTAAVVSSLLYWRERRLLWLMMIGLFTGLAMAEKLLPALWLPVYFTAAFAVWSRTVSARLVRRLGLVLGVAGLTFYLTWPALWVKTNLDDYYVRDVQAITADRHVEVEETETAAQINPASFYLRTVVGRTSPAVLLMSTGVLLLFIRYIIERYVFRRVIIRAAVGEDRRFIPVQVLGWLLAFAISFLVFVTVPAKQADRYAVPALVVLPLLAGVGWYILFRLVLDWLARRGEECAACRVLKPLMALLVGLVLLLRPVAAAPHAIAYNNPLFPNIRTATYFTGTTLSLSSREDDRVGYVLVYRNMYGRAPDDIASTVLDEFRGKEPVHVVSVLGQPYVWLYETLGLHYFRQHVGEVVGEVEVGQTVPISSDTFSAIEIGFATFSGRANTGDVVVHVRESATTTTDLRTVRVNARDIADESYHRFEFAPIPDAAGKTFFVSVTSPNSRPGNAVTVRFVDQDVLPGEMVLRREPLTAGQTAADFVRAGDVAYRIPQP